MALSLIDRLGLYNVVFTNSIDTECANVDTAPWSRTYDQLSAMIRANLGDPDASTAMATISRILLHHPDDVFLAWMIVCFVPWAKESSKPSKTPTSKRVPSPASLAAREGIKADNKVCKIVDNAVRDLQEIVMLKDSVINDDPITTSPLKRKMSTKDRASQGQAIRRWGIHWRSSVLFALLTETSKTESPTGKQHTILFL